MPVKKGRDLECWEPVEQLEARPMDNRGEIMHRPEDVEREYHSTVIGHALDDSEGGYSVCEVITGEGRDKDEALAQLIIQGLKARERELQREMTD